jgi:hypothetical protein
VVHARILWKTIGAIRQVSEADGFISGALLSDRRLTFWTMTVWCDETDMRAYMTSGFHGKVMPKLFRWCDEASVVHWTQEHDIAPDWLRADARMRADGRPSRVRNPSPNHQSMSFDIPRVTRPVPIVRRTS